jgi:hypothetical protein
MDKDRNRCYYYLLVSNPGPQCASDPNVSGEELRRGRPRPIGAHALRPKSAPRLSEPYWRAASRARRPKGQTPATERGRIFGATLNRAASR